MACATSSFPVPDSPRINTVAFINVRTSGTWEGHGLVETLAAIHQVQEIHYVAGGDGFLLKVRETDTKALGRLVRERISPLKGVVSTSACSRTTRASSRRCLAPRSVTASGNSARRPSRSRSASRRRTSSSHSAARPESRPTGAGRPATAFRIGTLLVVGGAMITVMTRDLGIPTDLGFLCAFVLPAVAGLLAMPTGFALSLILIYIINRRSFGWTLQMDVDLAPFLTALAVAVAAAIYQSARSGSRVTL